MLELTGYVPCSFPEKPKQLGTTRQRPKIKKTSVTQPSIRSADNQNKLSQNGYEETVLLRKQGAKLKPEAKRPPSFFALMLHTTNNNTQKHTTHTNTYRHTTTHNKTQQHSTTRQHNNTVTAQQHSSTDRVLIQSYGYRVLRL